MKSACGPPKWSEAPPSVTPSPLTPPSVTSVRAAPAPAQGPAPGPASLDLLDSAGSGTGSSASALHFANTLRELQESLLRSRSFYADLADVLCADEGFAARDSLPCWNGQRVGE